MKKNLVIFDRLLRMAAGAALLLAPLLDIRVYPVNLLGVVLIATALVGYCPLYTAMGWVARSFGSNRHAS
ncbi:MAG TPA: DUF2892 domain-containing protein [Polyangiaceae bacterium]|nr:DUF2892 domain-containing protein [Polyangiaceae bacterium]